MSRLTDARTGHKKANAEEDGVRAAIHAHALQFFLGHGGRREDWGEDQERSVREEMYRRWSQSEWGQARARKREAKYDRRWVGTSFDVGVFLGVDVLGNGRSPLVHEGGASPEASTSRGAASGAVSTTAETFVTAPTKPAESERQPYLTIHANGAESSSSITPLLPLETPEIMLNGAPLDTSSGAPTSMHALRGETSGLPLPSTSHGKALAVHYADEPPAPPGEVLGRAPEEAEDTSAGAAWQATAENRVEWGDVVMRGRFVLRTQVRVLNCSFRQNAGASFLHWHQEPWTRL